MHLKDRVLSFWKDPVWSKVIATGIIAGLGLLFASAIALPKPVFVALLIVGLCIGSYLVIKEFHGQKNKTLVYVSSGGTCRDPMAKAITAKLLEKRN